MSKAAELNAKQKALQEAAHADDLRRLQNAKNRAMAKTSGLDRSRLQERFVRRLCSQLARDFNGLMRARKIRTAGRYAENWRSSTGTTTWATAAVNAISQRDYYFNQYFSSATTAPELAAYTDFNQATLWVNAEKAPQYDDRKNVHKWSARLRGAMYHEIGHMEFTIPPRTLLMEADWTVGDLRQLQPRLEFLKTSGLSDSQKLDHLNFLPTMAQAWNFLEDQRMETAVVRAHAYAPRYLSPLITKLIVVDAEPEARDRCWLLLGGREYLPANLRQAALDRFNKWFGTLDQDVQDDLHLNHAITPGEEWLAIVNDYKLATTCTDLFVASVKALYWLERLGIHQEDQSHESMHEISSSDAKGRAQKGAASGVSSGQPADSAEGEDDGEGGGSGSGSNNAASGKGVGQGGGADSYGDLDEIARDLINDNIGDPTVGEALRKAEAGDLPAFDHGVQELPPEWVAKASQVSVGIERALQAFVTANEPIWRTRQETGYLDALAYRTREPGTVNYRRHLDDSGREGMDVHVSMLCDNSGSMGSNMGALSAALLAMAQACTNVGAGYDIVLWSSDDAYFRLEPEETLQPNLYPAIGGTEPSPALRDLEQSPVGQHVTNHLVLLFTDGAWYGDGINLKEDYASTDINRKFVLAKYGSCGTNTHGADRVVELTDILDFPTLLEEGLRELASVSR